jgi:hypothetical protein
VPGKRVLLTLALALVPAGGAAAAVTSRFDSDRESWTVVGDTASGQEIPAHVASGGNPGGFVRIDDAAAGGTMYWNAPSKFLGNRAGSHGKRLLFDLRQSEVSNQYDAADVILVGGGRTLEFNASQNPTAGGFRRYRVPLSSSAGWTKEGTSTRPTRAEFVGTLSALTALRIRAEYRSGADTDDLDNVVLEGDLAAPALGRTANVTPVRGTVLVAVPAGAAAAGVNAAGGGARGTSFVPLSEARQIPVGSLLDTSRGTVRLATASTSRRANRGDFTGGTFRVVQSRSRRARGLTELRLSRGSFRNCVVRGSAASVLDPVAQVARRTRRRVRRLRGNARGRFRTRGRYSAATVRGTIWTVTDRCDGTLTSVRRGRVDVRDFRGRRTIRLRAGRSYLARAPS